MTEPQERPFRTQHLSLEVRRLLCRWQWGAALLLGAGGLGFGMWQYSRTGHIGAAAQSANGALFLASGGTGGRHAGHSRRHRRRPC